MNLFKINDATRDYRGYGYEMASREAERLIASSGWLHNFERLSVLKTIMTITQPRENIIDAAGWAEAAF